MGEAWRAVAVSLRRGEKEERSVPPPRKPSPPAWETATARGEVAINRMGAEAMRGVEVHGYWVLRDRVWVEAILKQGSSEIW